MKNIVVHVITAILFIVANSQNGFAQTSDSINFVRVETILVPGVSSDEGVDSLSQLNKETIFSYFDGWGRQIQQVLVQANPENKDIVFPSYFDSKNRPTRSYLPYVALSSDGRLREDAITEQSLFYQTPPGNIPSDSMAYSTMVYEDSPLNRVISATNIGGDYQDKYRASRSLVDDSGQIRKWKIVSGLPQSTSTYSSGTLTFEESTDEENARTRTYSDYFGNMVLKSVEVETNQWLETYYVYNQFNELEFIIPPAASNIFYPSQTEADLWFYQRVYDSFGRQIATKKPGTGWTYIIYDQWERPVLTQNPGNRVRNPNEWNFIKYDIHNRPIYSGFYESSLSVSTLRDLVYASTNRFESLDSNSIGYTLNQTYPASVSIADVYSVTYYDNYSFLNLTGWDPEQRDYSYVSPVGIPDTKTTGTVKGLATGSKSRTTDSDQTEWTFEVSYFDTDYQEIQIVEGHILGGIARYSSEFAFSGELLSQINEYDGDFGNHVVYHSYNYDDQRRLISYDYTIDSIPETTIYFWDYDDLGNEFRENVHQWGGGSSSLFSKISEFNIQGNLTELDFIKDSESFYLEKIAYNENFYNRNTPRHDGMISAKIDAYIIENGDPSAGSNYNYNYDKSGRLLESNVASFSYLWNFVLEDANTEIFEYDDNDNIQSLIRYFQAERGRVAIIDSLVYDYSGNQLNSVLDSALAYNTLGPNNEYPQYFYDKNTTGTDYFYNQNGDLIEDKNKGVTLIEYDFLDLISQINFENTETIKYKYNIGGDLLQTIWLDSAGTDSLTRIRIGELEFVDGQLNAALFINGKFDPVEGQFNYYLKDYQGSTLMVFQDTTNQYSSLATFENSQYEIESSQFIDYNNSIRVPAEIFNHTKGTGNEYAIRIDGGFGENIGVGKAIQVMQWDTVRMEVFGKYLELDEKKMTPMLLSMVNTLATNGVSSGIDGALNSINFNINTNAFGGLVIKNSNKNKEAPPAYLNYAFFDKNKEFKYGGFVQLSEKAKENGTDVPHEKLSNEVVAGEDGYFYIFLSNESLEPSEVFFDDFSVIVSPGHLKQRLEYYASGVPFYQHTNIELDDLFQGKEYSTKSNLYDFHARHYDAALARWHNMDPQDQFASPYVAMGANPVMLVDPDGEFVIPVIVALVGGGVNLWSNFDKVKDFKTGLAYFGSGALGGLVSLANPFAGGATTSSLNFGIDLATGNVPKTDNPLELLMYGGGLALDGFSAGTSGTLVKSFAKGIAGQSWFQFSKAGPGTIQKIGTLSYAAPEFTVGVVNSPVINFAKTASNLGLKFADDAAKGAVQYSDDLVRAAQQTYPKLAGKTQLHHITPKYLGGAKNGPLVPLDGAYHQRITNEFRALWGYGKGVPSATELQSIMKQVYSKYPLPPGYGF